MSEIKEEAKIEEKENEQQLKKTKQVRRGRKPSSTKAVLNKELKEKQNNKKQAISIIGVSKRKRAIARAYVSRGNGSIFINNKNIELIEPKELRSIILEPFYVSPSMNSALKQVNIKINVFGGGLSSQAQASRNSIAKALIKFINTTSIKSEFNNYRYMIVDDPRRVESKKFKGPKARARFQTSYR